MEQIWSKIREWYIKLVNSIAFWPAVVTLVFLMVAFTILSFDNHQANNWIAEHFPQLSIDNPDNARLILGTLAGGTLSLTVFSFTMVMVVLSQATQSFSPRVIPGLITKKAHQVVLGFYIGTTVYLLLLILGFQNHKNDTTIPVAGILLAIVFGIVCLVLFVYFIHSISKSIQVNVVLNDIYRQGKRYLQRDDHLHENIHTADLLQYESSGRTPATLYALQAGYLLPTGISTLLQLAKKHDLKLEIIGREGDFVQAGAPLLAVLNYEELPNTLADELLTSFGQSDAEVIMDNAETAMKQISEIAVRALSPGINDPGTAKTATDLLCNLLALQMQQPGQRIFADEDGTARIIIYQRPFEWLLTKYLAPIRHYGRADLNMNLKLAHCLQSMQAQDTDGHFAKAIQQELSALQESYQQFLQPEADKLVMERMMR